jgi:mono/diheme cytochrome c family protein
MSQHNPELQSEPHPHPQEAIQPDAPDFVETPDTPTETIEHASLPLWIYLVCGVALFLTGSSFTGFSTFGLGIMDQGPGGPSVAAVDAGPAPVETPAMIGKKVYNNNCASCHQQTGEGQPGQYPPLGGSEWVIGNKERLAAIMLHGVAGPLTVRGGSYGSMVMPPWSGVLSNDQIASVMTYVRTSWGNTANEVTVAEVNSAQAKFASQTGAFCEADLMKIAPNGPDPSDKK